MMKNSMIEEPEREDASGKLLQLYQENVSGGFSFWEDTVAPPIDTITVP